MFRPDEWAPIVNQLLTLTERGKVEWAISPISAGAFMTDAGGTSYEIGALDADGQPPYYFSIGDVWSEVDRVRSDSPEAREGVFVANQFLESLGQSLPKLYMAANRQANQAPAKASQLLASLAALDEEDEGA